MFLSSIPVETGNDPNRPRPGRVWISNPYRVHQRLCMAFDGRPKNRTLFRIEGPVMTRRGIRPRILVQSQVEPDWDAAFGNAPFLIVGENLQVKAFDPGFKPGDKFRFLLRANPTVKRKDGARLGIMDGDKEKERERQIEWLRRKAEAGGFGLVGDVELLARGLQYSRRSRELDPKPHVHLAVTYTGLLEVLDGDRFLATVTNGIGSAKAYGFGLLSVVPV